MVNTFRVKDDYAVEWRGDAPAIITYRGARWGKLRGHLATLWEGKSKEPYIAIRTKTTKDALLARVAVANWVRVMKLPFGSVKTGISAEDPTMVIAWCPKRASPTMTA